MTTTPEDLRQAHTLDEVLAADVVPQPSAGLRRAILLGFEQRAQGGFWTTFWRELGGARIVGPALTASLALGIAVAAFVEPVSPATIDEAPDYAELALLDGAYEEYLP